MYQPPEHPKRGTAGRRFKTRPTITRYRNSAPPGLTVPMRSVSRLAAPDYAPCERSTVAHEAACIPAQPNWRVPTGFATGGSPCRYRGVLSEARVGSTCASRHKMWCVGLADGPYLVLVVIVSGSWLSRGSRGGPLWLMQPSPISRWATATRA